MNIQGKIIEIMETWPLMLLVQTENGQHQFTLDPNVKVVKQSQDTDVQELRTDQYIQSEVESLDSGARIIKSIEILKD